VVISKSTFRCVLFAASAFVTLGTATSANAGLINPGFEYGQPTGSYADYNDASIAPSGGWYTTETDHQIEVWGSGYSGVQAYQGSNFVELNANAVGTLYQTVKGIQTGYVVDYHFAHRGRLGNDTMQLDITDLTTGTSLFSQQYTDGKNAWGFYSGNLTVGAGIAATDTVKFAYTSVSAAGGNPTIGNFLDSADFGVGVNNVPEPTSLAIFGVGLTGLIVARRRRQAI